MLHPCSRSRPNSGTESYSFRCFGQDLARSAQPGQALSPTHTRATTTDNNIFNECPAPLWATSKRGGVPIVLVLRRTYFEQKVRFAGERIEHFEVRIRLEVFVERGQCVDDAVGFGVLPRHHNFAINDGGERAPVVHIEASVAGQRAIRTDDAIVVRVDLEGLGLLCSRFTRGDKPKALCVCSSFTKAQLRAATIALNTYGAETGPRVWPRHHLLASNSALLDCHSIRLMGRHCSSIPWWLFAQLAAAW